jgi:WD40 repeat protein
MLLAAGTGKAIEGDCYWIWSVDHTIRIWHVVDGETHHIFTEPQFGVEAVAFSPDGALVAGVGGYREAYLGNTGWGPNCSGMKKDALVRLWNIHEGRLIAELKGHKAFITGVKFSPDGLWLITAGADGTVNRWAVPGITQTH